MTEDGKLISQVDEKTFYTNNTSYNSFVKMDSETYMLAFTDAGNKGVLYTADIRSDLPFFKNQFIVHRDFHASNIMINKKKLSLIDSQDAIIGNPLYDVVSLIDDAIIRGSSNL